jgi:hypothetical protein
VTAPLYNPDKLLKELGITTPEEIDIEAIAEYCQATIVPQRLHGSAARIIGAGDRAFIIIDSKSPRARQRFSAAHELGHWMLDRGKLASFVCSEKNFINDWSIDNPERRANRYAANLLLPQFMFQPAAKNQEITFETVRALCVRFQTSLTATAIRLVEHGSFPAMLVCNGKEGRRWYFRGSDVPDVIQLRENPGAYTDAYDLLRGNPTSNKPVDVQADDWITHPRSRYYSIREESVKVYDDLVLSLLWWKDESQLLDLSDEDDY